MNDDTLTAIGCAVLVLAIIGIAIAVYFLITSDRPEWIQWAKEQCKLAERCS